MEIKKIVVGELETNCYIVIEKQKCLIIDPGSDAKRIIDACKNYQVEGILVTHHHFDHVGALEELEKYYHVKHNTFLTPSFCYEVISTPGHTSDSVTFYFKNENVMFIGDFLFYHTCGRWDLASGSIKDMKKSLENIKKYPDEIILYPGHGRTTILGEEKKYFNSYFGSY